MKITINKETNKNNVNRKLKYSDAKTFPQNLKSHIMRYLYISSEYFNWSVVDSLWEIISCDYSHIITSAPH
jgi:hypothetical protein